jgi:hypothetical protein
MYIIWIETNPITGIIRKVEKKIRYRIFYFYDISILPKTLLMNFETLKYAGSRWRSQNIPV